MSKKIDKDDDGCANCGRPVVEGSTLCIDCLPSRPWEMPETLWEKIDNLSSVIKALKAANKEKDKFICMLILDAIKKDEEIDKLGDRVKFLEKWLRWNKEVTKR